MSLITEPNRDESTTKTWGWVSVTPTDDVSAGTFATWNITFTVGLYALDVGGGLKIGTRRQADFGQPQFDDPTAENYSSVRCSRPETKLDVRFDPRFQRPFNAVIAIRLLEGPLYPGDTITLTMGDTSGGSPGLFVQSFPETKCDFAVFLDPTSSGVYKRVFSRSPTFKVVTGPCESMTVVAPSLVAEGKPFRVQVRGNDRFGNPTPVNAADLTLDGDPPLTFSISRGDGHATWLENVVLKGSGVRRLHLKQGENRLATSNPVVVEGDPGDVLCWGDTQAQTASTVGVGTPDEFFAYARDLAAIDFASHQGNDWILSDSDYAEVRAAAAKYHEPGRFAPFFGYEWSGPTGAGGDRNVLFVDDDGPIFRSNHWQLAPGEYAGPVAETECISAAALQERMRAYVKETGRKVILVPHIGGRKSDVAAQALDLEPVFEICSNHGIFEWRLHEFLERGVKVGVVGASDDHTCRPGLAPPSTPEMTILGGLGAVYAKEKTRPGIYDGLMARHSFATTGARMVLRVDADGHPMGSKFDAGKAPAISCTVHGTAPIDTVSIFNGSREIAVHHPNPAKRDAKRLRLIWQGANTQDRGRAMRWNGELKLTGGRIVAAEPLNMYAPKYGIVSSSANHVAWTSVTSGQESGLLLELDAPDDATITFDAGPATFEFTLGEARADDVVRHFGGLDQSVRASTVHHEGDAMDATMDAITEDNLAPGQHAYFVRVVQRDFHRAWSSPIYVNHTGK
jgi:hypothetical protein